MSDDYGEWKQHGWGMEMERDGFTFLYRPNGGSEYNFEVMTDMGEPYYVSRVHKAKAPTFAAAQELAELWLKERSKEIPSGR